MMFQSHQLLIVLHDVQMNILNHELVCRVIIPLHAKVAVFSEGRLT